MIVMITDFLHLLLKRWLMRRLRLLYRPCPQSDSFRSEPKGKSIRCHHFDMSHVYRLKRDFPHLSIVLNGGIETVDAVRTHLSQVDGVMIGRKAYADPFFLSELQDCFSEPGNGQADGGLRPVSRLSDKWPSMPSGN